MSFVECSQDLNYPFSSKFSSKTFARHLFPLWMVLIFIVIYSEGRDTENQQYYDES